MSRQVDQRTKSEGWGGGATERAIAMFCALHSWRASGVIYVGSQHSKYGRHHVEIKKVLPL